MKKKKKIKIDRVKNQMIQEATLKVESFHNEKLSKIQAELIEMVSDVIINVFNNYKGGK
jgi:hypothetical protein